MAQNTTIKDIARALGISKSTVSRALADRFDVKPETKKAVLEMAEKMHYRPNPFAQNLIKRRTKIIGVVVPEFINSFFARIIIQIQKVFESEGFHVLITQCNESAEAERRNLQLLEESMVEGILISVTEKGRNTAYYQELIDNGIPLVFFNRASADIQADKVVIDDYKWAFFAVEHLVNIRRELGQMAPRIMHFQGPAEIGLSGLSFAWYLKKHCTASSIGVGFFGIFYALSGYMAAYSWNIMWLDCILLFPLIVYGLEELVENGGGILYCLTLGLSILSNYYISIMTCLFLVLYFIALLILKTPRTFKGGDFRAVLSVLAVSGRPGGRCASSGDLCPPGYGLRKFQLSADDYLLFLDF